MQNKVNNEFRKCMLAAPDRILVATDLTDLDYLVPHAVAQARVCGASLTFVHVLSPARAATPDSDASGGPANLHNDSAKIIRDARLLLLGVERQVEEQGIACDSCVRQGGVTEVISREINQTDATRLIVGMHGRSRVGQLTIGSVTNRLLTLIQVPVMVIRPQMRNAEEHSTLRRILHPVSLMEIDQDNAKLPLNIAQACRAALTLLHVVDPGLTEYGNSERVIEWATGRLRNMVPLSDLMPAIHTRVSCGDLAEEILKAAEQTGADLILLGTSGYSAQSFKESVAYKVLTAASCPVLTYHHKPYWSQIEALEAMGLNSPDNESTRCDSGRPALPRMAHAL